MELRPSEIRQIDFIFPNRPKQVEKVIDQVQNYVDGYKNLAQSLKAIDDKIADLNIESEAWEVLSCAKGIIKNRQNLGYTVVEKNCQSIEVLRA